MSVFMTRNISASAEEAISKKFAGQATKGAASPRQGWSRALLYIGALDTDPSVFVFELWQRALQIAKERGDDDLRSESAIREKLEKELQEYQEALEDFEKGKNLRVDVANRLSNVLYYAVQIYSKSGNIPEFMRTCESACNRARLPVLVGLHIAAKKMRSRGQRAEVGLKKSVETEYREMQRVLDNLE